MDAFITYAQRTPIGRSHPDKGIFRDVRADELLATLLRHFAADNDLLGVDDILIGCVGQHLEQGKNLARLSALLAGFPVTIPAATINRLCASAMQAVNNAALCVHAGQCRAVLAGGVEHMHHVPMAAALGYNEELLSRFAFPFTNMGLTAEEVAGRYGISRTEQDAFALNSHDKAVAAQDAGWFDAEIVPVDTPQGQVSADQGPRQGATLEKMAGFKTIFTPEGGTVTAGNASPLNDGASLVAVANKAHCDEAGWTPRAEIIDHVAVGVDPLIMGMCPVPAVRKLLDRQKLSVDDVDLFELNEAFASQSIACIRELNIDEEKVNPAGGAIALGHPLGCTGTRLVVTLLAGLERTGGELGIASQCVGHGQGVAMLIRRI